MPSCLAFVNHSSSDPSLSRNCICVVKRRVCVDSHAHLCGHGSELQTNFRLTSQAFHSLYRTFPDRTPKALIVSSATDLSQMTPRGVSSLLPSGNSLSYFGFRLLYTEHPLAWVRPETHLQVHNESSQTPSGLVAKPNLQPEFAYHNTRPLHRYRPSLLCIGDVVFVKEAKDESRLGGWCSLPKACRPHVR